MTTIDNDMEKITIRKATSDDIDAITGIYGQIHRQEREGKVTIGWDADTYPIRQTAEEALNANSLYVMTLGTSIVASAIINQIQPDAYSLPDWKYRVSPDKVGVLHTLVVNPTHSHRGLGRQFVDFFERHCREKGWEVARLDTQEKNTRALKFYPKIGYRLAGIYPTRFFTLPTEIRLAMFEKRL